MILKREIERIAEQKKAPKATIDKDWVSGHFINAIFSLPECRQNLVFKGGKMPQFGKTNLWFL